MPQAGAPGLPSGPIFAGPDTSAPATPERGPDGFPGGFPGRGVADDGPGGAGGGFGGADGGLRGQGALEAPPLNPRAAAATAAANGRGLTGDLPTQALERGKAALGLVAKTAAAADAAIESHAQAAERLLRTHPEAVEADASGAPVVRGEVLVVAPTPQALARARRAGFRVGRTETLPGLGLSTATLMIPRGVSATEALHRLRALDPEGAYDLNHIYFESGAARASADPAGAVSGGAAGGTGVRVGLVDGSVASGHPALRGVRLVQRAFAPGGAHISAHATAIASLLAGRDRHFRGASPGATLMVADVYGRTPAGGSATAIAGALSWLAEARTPVINISLVGPPNAVLAAAVKALVNRGHLLVAAVGNDGPAAPPLYPAAYPGVVAVTAVDARRRVLPEAGRAGHVDFAAPGAQMAAAGLDGRYVIVRGTSFAAPIVAGKLAALAAQPSPAPARRALTELARQADDLGAPGQDPIYGRGLVGFDLRADPAAVGATALALRDR